MSFWRADRLAGEDRARVWGSRPGTHVAWGDGKNVVLKLLRFVLWNHSALDSRLRYMRRSPGPICGVTASTRECRTFPFSGHQRPHFLGEGTLGQSPLGADSPVLPGCAPGGRTLDSGQSVVECDSGAQILSFKNVVCIAFTIDFRVVSSVNI